MNKIMLIGNVGKEPTVRYYDHDQAVATFPLATTERGYTLQNGTQVPDRTDWHNIVMYRGLAKIVERYVHKGDKQLRRPKGHTPLCYRGLRRQHGAAVAKTVERAGAGHARNN